MNTDFEPVMAAQFAALQAAATLNLVATAAANSPILTDVSDFSGLFPGLPMFGPGVVRGATILSLDPEAASLTLTAPIAAAATDAAFTTGFLTTGRRRQHWSQVKAQPALYFVRIGATDEEDEPFVKTTLEAEAWIYANSGQNPNAVPDTMLGCLERMVRRCFVPVGADQLEGRFTLGRMVYWSRISGRTDAWPGDQGPQAVAKIPIRITLLP